MNNKRSCCGIAGAVGIILGMVPMMTTACVPGYDVVLHGYDPEWAHVACAYGHDGMVFNGSADNWSYWYYSYSTGESVQFASCDYAYASCHDYGADVYGIPMKSVTLPAVGKYDVIVMADDEFLSVGDSDAHTVYAVEVDLSADTTLLRVGDDRVPVSLLVSTAGPTDDCKVRLSVGGIAPNVEVWTAETGGTRLVAGRGNYEWNAGSVPSCVYVQGTAATDDCEIWLRYVDPYSIPHPAGCAAPTVELTVVQCAHPVCFQAVNCGASAPEYYESTIYYAWASTSGDNCDLANCRISESFCDYYENRPPFYAGSAPPAWPDMSMDVEFGSEEFGDMHGMFKSLVHDYQAGLRRYGQLLKWKCLTCGAEGLLTVVDVSFTVYDKEPSPPPNDWHLSVKIVPDCPGYTCESDYDIERVIRCHNGKWIVRRDRIG